MTQQEALIILKTGANVFLTGEPGSGKTHTVNRYVAWLRDCGMKPAITASTGIAATHIGGFTIHSWSGIGIRSRLDARDLVRMERNKRLTKRIRSAQVLIIDEVSMLAASTLSLVELVCRHIRGNRRAFGGLQVLLVGDFFQLPPIVRYETSTGIQPEMFATADTQQSQFAFMSPVWNALNLIICYLTEQYRQEDAAYLEMLTAIRRGTVSAPHRALLDTRRKTAAPSGIPQLFSHNADVDRINAMQLATLPETAHAFTMEGHGVEKIVAQLKKGCLSPETLSLKVGARVMFTKNNFEEKYVNGTLGTVVGFSKDHGYPLVKTLAGRMIAAEPAEWTVEENERVLAQIRQIPLRLAWALTVHKSQGMSLDAAHMDLSGSFAYGQGYVALSRVRSLAGLSLAGLNERALQIHPDVRAKDAEFRNASNAALAAHAHVSAEELAQRHNAFVQLCGGVSPRGDMRNNAESTSAPAVQHKKAYRSSAPTREITYALLKDGKSVAEIMETRGLAASTIFSHIADLYRAGRIGRADVEPLASGVLRQALPVIHAAFKELGVERLSPVFEKLRGAHSYEDLRLARMLME